MNYKEADLPDDTYKMLRKYFGDYHKDGRPKPPGYRGPKPNEIKPVITGRKMKTFKEFNKQSKEKKIATHDRKLFKTPPATGPAADVIAGPNYKNAAGVGSGSVKSGTPNNPFGVRV